MPPFRRLEQHTHSHNLSHDVDLSGVKNGRRLLGRGMGQYYKPVLRQGAPTAAITTAVL